MTAGQPASDLNFEHPEAWTDADWDEWTSQLPDQWWSKPFDAGGSDGPTTVKTLLYDQYTQVSWLGEFTRLAQPTKLAFFEAWYESHDLPGSGGSDDPSEPIPADSELFFTTITLPDGSTVVETHDGSGVVGRDLINRNKRAVRELELDDAPLDETAALRLSGQLSSLADERESNDGVVISGGGGGIGAIGMALPLPRRLLALLTPKTMLATAGAGVAAVAVGAVALSGGGDTADPAGSAGGGVPVATSSSGDSGGGSSAGGVVATEVSANACEAAHDQQNIVDLASPDDVQPAIPQTYTRGEASVRGFPTPYLEWSELPPETTEIAVLVLRLTQARGTEYAANPTLWWTANPSGVVVWKVTGIDASLQALPATSADVALPEGAVERMHGNGRLTLGDEVYEQKFWINTGEPHLFTVFALCDPPLAGTADDYNQPWLIQNAVAVGWFITALEQ